MFRISLEKKIRVTLNMEMKKEKENNKYVTDHPLNVKC